MNGAFDFGYSSFIYPGLTFGTYKDPNNDQSYLTGHYQSDQFENLLYFNASGSAVQDVVKIIGILGSSLEVLDVSSNYIGHLNEAVFDRFSQLRYLNLQNTNLKSFDFNLKNRAELQVLDISYNNLNRINFTPFAGRFENLRTLHLIGNKLDDIDFVTPMNFPKLTTLVISHNEFRYNYLNEFLRQWPNLNVMDWN